MEWITHDGHTAPRLAATRPAPDLLEHLYRQLVEAMSTLAEHGLVHGDLSPYNVLVAGDRLVVIDLPQVVDLAGNPAGADYLLRDCVNMTRWFTARGLVVDPDELFGELMGRAYG